MANNKLSYSPMDATYKKLYRLGIVAYIVLLILSLVFYKERIVFTDTALHLFSIITDSRFAFQNFRYGAAVTQVFPLIARKLLLPLDITMMVYSAGFVVYYLVCYVICGSIMKNYRMALVLLLFNILFVTETFYWPISELPQGVAFLIVVFGYLTSRDTQKIKAHEAVILSCCFILLHFFHPLLFAAGLYMFCFFLSDRETMVNKKLLTVMLLWYVLMLAVRMKLFVTEADSSKMDNVNKFKEMFPDYFSNSSTYKFVTACGSRFYWIPVTLLLVIWRYIKDRRVLMLLLVLLSFTGYLLLINVSYPEDWLSPFYMENFYLLLGVILAMPLIYHVLPGFKKPVIGLIVISVIIMTGLIRIYSTHTPFSRRLDWERKFLEKNIDRKLVIDETKVPTDTLIMVWGAAYEFWLLSTIENGRTASIVISNNTQQYEWAIANNKAFVPTWSLYNYKDLPEKYFRFTDTVNNYTIIK